MSPSLRRGERFLANRSVRDPRRGEVVVYRAPSYGNKVLVRRVIAVAGDRVAVQDGRVLLNGRLLKQGPARSDFGGDGMQAAHETLAGRRYSVVRGGGSRPGRDMPERRVPEGHCFVLGDNRDFALDSRHHSFVPLSQVLGRVDYILYPADDWERFGVFGAPPT
jgi:signal peptidase I